MATAQQKADELAQEFRSLPDSAKLDYLLELADALPALPPRYAEHPDLLERVEECQSPVYLFVEVNEDRVAHLFITAPIEAPTTRGFASILHATLDGQEVSEILSFDNDFPTKLGLTELVSPLRIRGMQGMLNRIKKQVASKING